MKRRTNTQKTNTLKDLAKWIAAEIQPDDEGSRCLTMEREWVLDPSRGLHQRTADELVALHDRLCRAIPDDFDFYLDFEDGEIDGTLEFQDGMMGGCGGPLPVRPDRKFIENLRNFDWDELRGEAMTMTQSMESEVSGPVPDWFKEHIASQRKH